MMLRNGESGRQPLSKPSIFVHPPETVASLSAERLRVACERALDALTAGDELEALRILRDRVAAEDAPPRLGVYGGKAAARCEACGHVSPTSGHLNQHLERCCGRLGRVA